MWSRHSIVAARARPYLCTSRNDNQKRTCSANRVNCEHSARHEAKHECPHRDVNGASQGVATQEDRDPPPRAARLGPELPQPQCVVANR